MRQFAAVLGVFVLCTISAFSQSANLGTIVVSKDGGTTTTVEIAVFRTSTGQTQYQINWESFQTTDPLIDRMSTDEIQDALGEAAVETGIQLGYHTPSNGSTTTVLSADCLERYGSGWNTRIVPDADCSSLQAQKYTVDWSTTSASMTYDAQPVCMPAPNTVY